MDKGATEDKYAVRRYQKELPEDRTNFVKAWKLLEQYSGVPADEVDQHVMRIRDKAFDIWNYPCIGRWRFLDLYITTLPEYPAIVDRLKAGESLLDVGCCFGHVLRQLAFDGAPAANLAGTDLRQDFIDLGYELFRDGDKFGATLVAGDIFDASDAGLASLNGRFNIVHAASFFHLFSWDEQVVVGQRVVQFFKPDAADALIIGRQVGSPDPPSLEEYRQSGERRYHHNVASLQHLWDVIGEKTGTKWKVTGNLSDRFVEGDFDRTVIKFAVSRVS